MLLFHLKFVDEVNLKGKKVMFTFVCLFLSEGYAIDV